MVKPAPASLRDYLQQRSFKPFSDSSSHWTNSRSNISRLYDDEKELPVDYAFLDEDEELDYNSVDGFNIRSMRKKREVEQCDTCVKTGAHIVFKRRDVSEVHASDYSEYLIR